ncbi:DNA-binding transcriptional regulator, CsgD family [Lutibacter oricola]|uniref:DNA-binding transcriptional regulator, CsgD family n=1 Tax=Lutibacter oricola TaxID=762486 RepID=A0A1H2QV42_9FLAO|nr:hypothetical protein [Lutibacter oricola]SDW10309.1 DNA-binding transcriptional regulator, CsgD family [Lutibacter oricola]
MIFRLKNTLLFLLIITCFQFEFQAQNKEVDSLIGVAEQHLKQSKLLTGTANYPEAYDLLWNVLSVADSIKNSELKYKSYQQLSILYSIFHNKTKAVNCLDSMFVYAKLSKFNNRKLELTGAHYTTAVTYRMNENYPLAKKHLAICNQLFDSLNYPFKKRIFVLSETAHIHTLEGNFKNSEIILRTISNEISSKNKFNSILYSMWGDLYFEKGNKQKALEFYTKSLATISKQKTRIGLRVELLEKISSINQELGNYKMALEQINESKILGDSLFGGRSASNHKLFEIKDSYRKAIENHQKIQQKQQVKLLQNDKEKLNQKLTFSTLLILVCLIAAAIVIILLRKKHAIEKKLEKERSLTAIEIKKKELAVTALQLIEKDNLLDEVKKGLDKVKTETKSSAVEDIKSTIRVNSAKNWEDFETRFVQINSNFYTALGEKHSNLSASELKICALIKLNFSSKEMAKLLGISPESINKARYRLRKKLGLSREDNLVTYINGF